MCSCQSRVSYSARILHFFEARGNIDRGSISFVIYSERAFDIFHPKLVEEKKTFSQRFFVKKVGNGFFKIYATIYFFRKIDI